MGNLFDTLLFEQLLEIVGYYDGIFIEMLTYAVPLVLAVGLFYWVIRHLRSTLQWPSGNGSSDSFMMGGRLSASEKKARGNTDNSMGMYLLGGKTSPSRKWRYNKSGGGRTT